MKKLLYLSAIVLMISCGDNSSDRTDGFTKGDQAPEDSLFDEVMHGHDTAMAKMGKLGRYRKEVESKLDSLAKVGGAAKASAESALKQLGAELKNAEDGMNKWMEDFEIDSAQDNIEKRLEYLKSEKFKVDEVKDNIFKALNRADSLLSK
ncbi:MAG: hypothetical protein J7497_04030 [Chitinophagaceae bacterium]|nr:hypothetical protein [Chitinophagaceae bacterium]